MIEINTEYVFEYTWLFDNMDTTISADLIVHNIDGETVLKYRNIVVPPSYVEYIETNGLNGLPSYLPMSAEQNMESEWNGMNS